MSTLRNFPRGGLTAAVTFALSLTVGTVSIMTPAPAHAQLATVCVNCSTFWTQLVSYAEEASTALSTGESYLQQVQMYENMVKQGLPISEMQFSNVMQDMQSLNGLVAQGRQLAYSTSDLQNKFKQSFPDYQKYLDQGATWQDAQENYGKWSDETKDASLAALRTAGAQMDQIDGSEASTLNALQQHAQTAEGRKQALDASNEIAVEQVKQLQKLRQLIATQMQLQANSVAAAQGRMDTQNALHQNQYATPAPTTGGDHPAAQTLTPPPANTD